MADIHALFADYASYHKTAGNKAFHRLGIPLIMLTAIGMLVRVQLFHAFPTAGGIRVDAAMLLIAASTIYYLTVEWRLALAMLAVSIAFYFAGAWMPMWLNVALFILGWVFQFIGHSVYEKQNPAFFRNFVHLLVGPLWILNDLIPVVKTAARVQRSA
jgi:uncharacterized membrane protein YGL010W